MTTVNGTAQPFRIGWLGTSIMEHREAYSPRLTDQADMPRVGDTVVVEEHHSRGYVHRVHLALQLAHPQTAFACDNYGQGGATSRDLAATARALPAEAGYHLAVFGCVVSPYLQRRIGGAALLWSLVV
jgi:hypothetical protein